MKFSRIILVLISLVLFVGCSDPINCIIPREPELDNKTFPIASLENYYYVELNAEIRNEPRDDDYDYYFEVEGLPQGMDYYVNYRTISVEGTPEFSGTYEITIYVYVEGPFRPIINEQPDILCNYSTSKTYILIVE